MKALVLGGNGFIGLHLVKALLKSGMSVRVFDNSFNGLISDNRHVDCHCGDFSDNTKILEALHGIDVVYHLISTSLPGTSNLDPVADIEGNLIASVNLFENMVKLNIGKIVYLSSGGTVYGNPVLDMVSEDHPLSPLCSYGIIKSTIEKYLIMFQKLYGLQPIILRPSNPFGPGQGHIGVQGVIATFFNQIKNEQTIDIWGNGSAIRDYIYISDLIDLCVKAGYSDRAGIYNAGTGKGCSLNDLVIKIKKVTGISPTIKYNSARAFDVKQIILDIARAEKAFDWSPCVPIDQGLNMYWQWLQ